MLIEIRFSQTNRGRLSNRREGGVDHRCLTSQVSSSARFDGQRVKTRESESVNQENNRVDFSASQGTEPPCLPDDCVLMHQALAVCFKTLSIYLFIVLFSQTTQYTDKLLKITTNLNENVIFTALYNNSGCEPKCYKINSK